jgi:hypothetical protein
MHCRFLPITAVLLVLTSALVQAQWRAEPFVATELATSSFQNQSRLFLGARAGWNINGQYWIGGGLYTLLPRSPLTGSIVSRRDSLSVLYGGPTIGYTLWQTPLVELSVQVVVGLGGLGIRFRDPQIEARRYDIFLVVQPEMILFINAARSFRIFTGGNYRYAQGINTPGFSDDLLRQSSAFLGVFFALSPP